MAIIENKPEIITQVIDFNENIKKWLLENGFEATDNHDMDNQYKTIRYRHKELPISISTHRPDMFEYDYYISICDNGYGKGSGTIDKRPFGYNQDENLIEFIDDMKMRLVDACLLAKEFLIMIKGETL